MNYELKIKGKPYRIDRPKVMGILNCTPDSFYTGSRFQTEDSVEKRTRQIIDQGGEIIDVGGMSTRPGGAFVTEMEEMRRLRDALPTVTKICKESGKDVLVSVDTYRANVAKMAVEELGVDIINDVGAPENKDLHGLEVSARDKMYQVVAELKVPYILMASCATHGETFLFFKDELRKLSELGVEDVILDSGYGFGKTQRQNYELLSRQQEMVDRFGLPLLVGVSRKRMIWQTLDITPEGALNGTTILNTMATERGAAILRVHDVKEAVECVKLVTELAK